MLAKDPDNPTDFKSDKGDYHIVDRANHKYRFHIS